MIICMYVYIYTIFIYLFICLFIYLFISVFICLFVYLFSSSNVHTWMCTCKCVTCKISETRFCIYVCGHFFPSRTSHQPIRTRFCKVLVQPRFKSLCSLQLHALFHHRRFSKPWCLRTCSNTSSCDAASKSADLLGPIINTGGAELN
jgi:hypothetical protein